MVQDYPWPHLRSNHRRVTSSNSVQMKPLNDYIFIEKDNVENVTSSGIILSGEIQKEGAATGTIIDIGPDVEGIEVGKKVVFNEHQYDLLFVHKEHKTDILVGKKPGIYAYVA